MGVQFLGIFLGLCLTLRFHKHQHNNVFELLEVKGGNRSKMNKAQYVGTLGGGVVDFFLKNSWR